MADTSRPARSIPLDVLRGVAILLVLGRHDIRTARPSHGPAAALANALFRIGWTGVDLFFVLSGFLVGGLVFAEVARHGDFDAWRFVRRRWFRTIPLYLAFVAALFVALKFEKGAWPPGKYLRSNLAALKPYLTLTQNYTGCRADGYIDQTWSLAVEEHFYLILPLAVLLLLVCHRRDPAAAMEAVPWIALGLTLGCTALRLCLNGRRPFDLRTHYTMTHVRIDALFFGVALAYLHRFRRPWLERLAARRWALVAAGVGLVIPFAVLDVTGCPYVWTVGYVQLYLGYGCLVVAAAMWPSGRPPGRLSLSLATVGFFSYGIYLWHNDAIRPVLSRACEAGFLAGAGPAGRWAVVHGLYVAAAMGLAWASYRAIERPMLRLRDRWCPARGDRP